MPWFEYYQNNSHGRLDQNDNVDKYVFIEAVDGESANLYAESIGIYFDGCKNGVDCTCCGDRWNPVWDDNQSISLHEVMNIVSQYWAFSFEEVYAILHYNDGRKKRIQILGR